MTDVGRVLVVDDDESIRLVARASLERIGGYSVWCADSGESATEMVQTRDFDVILLDVVMGGMSGPETLREICRGGRVPRVPVLFFTAQVLPHERRALLGAGAIGLVEKPFDPVELCSAVRQVMGQANGGLKLDSEEMVGRLWEEASVSVGDDLGRIEEWCTFESGNDAAAARDAWRASHRLAGALGVFGFAEAGCIASRLAALLSTDANDGDTAERARGMLAEIRRLANLAA